MYPVTYLNHVQQNSKLNATVTDIATVDRYPSNESQQPKAYAVEPTIAFQQLYRYVSSLSMPSIHMDRETHCG